MVQKSKSKPAEEVDYVFCDPLWMIASTKLFKEYNDTVGLQCLFQSDEHAYDSLTIISTTTQWESNTI